ncbi:MAG: hypothetical protein AAFQ23_13490, partial [Cyanobacteria bacterium J06623_1]
FLFRDALKCLAQSLLDVEPILVAGRVGQRIAPLMNLERPQEKLFDHWRKDGVTGINGILTEVNP